MLTRLNIPLFVAVLATLLCAEPAAEEYHVKGAFLLNFAKFIEWPEQVFKGPTDPIVICIAGQNPFGSEFERAARDIEIAARSITVREVSDPQQATQCQILFISSAERKRARVLLQSVQTGSVLTVGEWEGFIAGGGVIDFKVEDDKVRIEISTAAADRAKLRISSKLLSLAQAGKK